jgi:hypothetical protein
VQDSDRAFYGQTFDIWCDTVYKILPPSEAKELIRDISSADIALNGEHPWNILYDLSVRFNVNDPDQSYEGFHKISNADERMITGNTHGSSSVRPVGWVGQLDMNDNPLQLAPLSPPTREGHFFDPPFVHFVACDWRYWEIFHENLLSSLQFNESIFLTHVHIANPECSGPELRRILSKRYPTTPIALTTEYLNVPAEWTSQWKGENIRSLYTCLRFLRAAEILTYYRKPLVITEFDAELTDRINNIIAATSGMDVGLCFYNAAANYFPWNCVWAGTAFVAPTKGGISYMQYVAQYCAKVFIEGAKADRPMWHIDQNALFMVYSYFRANHSNISIERYPGSARPVKTNFGNQKSR